MKKLLVLLIKLLSLVVVLLGALFFVFRGLLDEAVNSTIYQIEYGPIIDPDQRPGLQVEPTDTKPAPPHSGDETL